MNTETLRDVPVELRRLPPAGAVAWVERMAGAGARVVGVRRLPNAWAAAVHAVTVERAGRRHDFVLRRWARRDIPPDEGIVEHEAEVLTMLESTSLAVPRLVAYDPAGTECDVPAVLMTRLSGCDVLDPADLDRWIDDLAAMLHAVHEVADPGTTLGTFAPYNLGTVAEAPTWSRRPDVWEQAIEVAHQPIPDVTAGLCHRDFHPGNVLWSQGQVSGIVDWTHACRGPAAADVAHCRINLAMLHGLDVAARFAQRYGDVDALAWFDVSDAVGMADRPPSVWRFHDAGRTDLTTEALIDALDAFVADTVERVG